jgi:hypothetical protein
VTEAQLKTFAPFQSLPVYDESDPQASSIATVAGARSFRAIHECSTLRQVQSCLRQSDLVPLGALRADANGQVVVAYFGEK